MSVLLFRTANKVMYNVSGLHLPLYFPLTSHPLFSLTLHFPHSLSLSLSLSLSPSSSPSSSPSLSISLSPSLSFPLPLTRRPPLPHPPGRPPQHVHRRKKRHYRDQVPLSPTTWWDCQSHCTPTLSPPGTQNVTANIERSLAVYVCIYAHLRLLFQDLFVL